MMTEELPPLPSSKVQLTQNPLTDFADDSCRSTCLLEAVESTNDKTPSRNRIANSSRSSSSHNHRGYDSIDDDRLIRRTSGSDESPGILYLSKGNSQSQASSKDASSSRRDDGEYFPKSKSKSKSGTVNDDVISGHKGRVGSPLDGDAPILDLRDDHSTLHHQRAADGDDHQSVSTTPYHHTNTDRSPSQNANAGSKSKSKSEQRRRGSTNFDDDVVDVDVDEDGDDYSQDPRRSQKANNNNNGGVVFISEDVKAERNSIISTSRSQSMRQNPHEGIGSVGGKHRPMVRTFSEPPYPQDSIRVGNLPKVNSDLLKLASLDPQFLQSPIASAILSGDHALLLVSVQQGEDTRAVCPNSGCTFFHLVAQASTSDRELGWTPMIFLLSNAGADPNAKDKDGVTPVGIAITRKLVQIVAALLKCGAEVSGEDMFQAEQIRGVVKPEMMETIRRLTPSYWSAVHDLTPFKVNRLAKAWARVNLTRHGKTLIEYAKENARDEAIVKLLLQNEASIELAHAVMAGDLARVKVLLCDSAVQLHTCDTSVKNNYLEPFSGLTLLGAARKLGHADVLKELEAAHSRQHHRSHASSSSAGAGFGAGSSPSGSMSSGSRSSSRRESGYSSSSSFSGGSAGVMKNTTVVFYKGSSNEEVCEIRNTSKPITSALCAIV